MLMFPSSRTKERFLKWLGIYFSELGKHRHCKGQLFRPTAPFSKLLQEHPSGFIHSLVNVCPIADYLSPGVDTLFLCGSEDHVVSAPTTQFCHGSHRPQYSNRHDCVSPLKKNIHSH